jgi:hypothetical protein
MAWATGTRSVLDRPLGLKEFEASKLERISAHEGGKVVSLK